ncbi:MAG: phage terminase large subunit [Ignavibacteriaceae bacterium]|jgi:predicted phage terminase large subunit-like protein|nr:phage terminase large subunit [Ignavibacteriaceae bacterium]
MVSNVVLNIDFHEKQREVFSDKARFKIIAKGRRFGLTKGMAFYAIHKAYEPPSDKRILWVDTIYGNINRYYERYFMPVIKETKLAYEYKRQDNIFKIKESYIDFRSADRPENIEGQGYNLIIINEAGIILKNRRLWTETILPMVIDYKAEVIIGGTPKGKFTKKNERHLFYELFEKGKQQKNWKSFNYSTYDNVLLDPNEIREVENEIPPFLRQQEIYGKFIEENEAQIIKHEWWRFYQVGPSTSLGIERIVQSWDTAFKTKEENDFSVCTTWGITKNKFLLLHLFRERMEFPELKRKAAELFLTFKPSVVLIEDKASGQSLIQELERETRIPIRKIKVDKDKYARFISVTPLIESGKVELPEGELWVPFFINEMEEFPNGEFDDIVDSTTQFLNEFKSDGNVSFEITTVDMREVMKGRK